jgi:hypothetical protein
MDSHELEGLDLSLFAEASDIQVGIIPNEDGLWLTVIQETELPLDEVPILPGFHRYVPNLRAQNSTVH